MSSDHFLMLASPGATIIAAGAAVFVTWRLGKEQQRIAKQQATIAQQQADLAAVRLQHDLFDRRFAIYDTTRLFLVREVYPNRIPNDEAIRTFVRGTADAVFLLDHDLTVYLEEMGRRAVRLQTLKTMSGTMIDQEQRSKAVREQAELFQWFVDQFPILIDKFKPFLTLRNLGLGRLPSSVLDQTDHVG